MTEEIILGIVQGITEWLPVSSSGMLLLIENNFFANSSRSLVDNLQLITFLHLGTFFSALIYFRRDVWNVIKTLFSYKKQSQTDQALFHFLLLTTIVTGIVGYGIKELIEFAEGAVVFTGPIINAILGLLLIGTAIASLKKRESDNPREIRSLNGKDSVFLGILQGLSAFPGISRSGTTVFGILFRRFEKESALRVSFIMGLPVTLGANIVWGTFSLVFTAANLVAFFFSFIFGLLTIHVLLRFAERVNVGYFLLLFGILLVLASFLPL
ncbi:hypothetical protein CL654_01295 [bacterium]|nr:hypothetical protein [bacterium]|tara:strand:- start:5984 stop:6790 length:807 start_codon:yes stop_codon:yes gene_type:complete